MVVLSMIDLVVLNNLGGCTMLDLCTNPEIWGADKYQETFLGDRMSGNLINPHML